MNKNIDSLPSPSVEEIKVILKHSTSYWDFLDNIGLNREKKHE